MKTANALINPAVNNIRTAQPKKPATLINQEAREIVNDLFKSLQAAKPGWRASFPDDESLRLAKATFVKGLIESNITDRSLIAIGMRKARSNPSQFFPSIGEFIAWCKPSPEDLGLPSAQAAWRECCDNCHRKFAHRWSHPAVFEAGKRTGWFEIRHGSLKPKHFEVIYQKVMDEVLAGATFEVPKRDANLLECTRGRKTRTEQAKARGNAVLNELQKALRALK